MTGASAITLKQHSHCAMSPIYCQTLLKMRLKPTCTQQHIPRLSLDYNVECRIYATFLLAYGVRNSRILIITH